MVHYVGLDVSLKQTSICVVDQAGSVVRAGVVDSDPEAIAAFVRSKAPGALRIGLETGPTTTWLWTELKRLGLPVICIDARHAKAVLEMQINKSDRNDAAGIARIMQTGWFKEVRVKDIDSHLVKALLVSRALLVKIKRDLENQIRGLLKNLGLVIGRAKFNVFAVRTEELAESHRKRLFVGTVTKLAHELGSCVIAEGVETEVDFFSCREAGCDLVQGYFVARPTTDMRELALGQGRTLAA
jgi:transposase